MVPGIHPTAIHALFIEEAPAMRVTLPGVLAVHLLLAVSSQAAAQTPRYAMKDLPKPTNALYCSGAASLNEAGDVAMNCTYKGGTRAEPARYCLSSNWCLPYTARLPWYYSLPTVWQANGTVRTLSLPTRASFNEVFVLNSGAVIAKPHTTRLRHVLIASIRPRR